MASTLREVQRELDECANQAEKIAKLDGEHQQQASELEDAIRSARRDLDDLLDSLQKNVDDANGLI